MNHTAMIKLWRLFDGNLVRNPDALPAGTEVIQRGAMTLGGPLGPGDKIVPLLVDHDEDQPIGFVRELSNFADTDGEWLCAHVTITDAPPWLRKGTPASIQTKVFQRSAWGPLVRVLRGWVPEVSVLSPGVRPAEPRAKVLLLERSIDVPPKTAPAAVTASRHVAAAGTRSDVEAQIARELQQAWQREAPPGILRRPGIGRVLEVR